MMACTVARVAGQNVKNEMYGLIFSLIFMFIFYQLNFKYLTLNLELILIFFHRNLFISFLLLDHYEDVCKSYIYKLFFVCKLE